MQPYTVCTILLFFAVIINLFTRNRIAVYYTLFPALLAIFLMLLFNDYGPDIQAYKRFYAEIVPEIFWERGIDLGYAAIMAFVKILGGEFYMFLALVNIMALALIFNVFDRYSPYIALSWLLYFSLYIGYNHTILRQGIALVSINTRGKKSTNKKSIVLLVHLILAIQYAGKKSSAALWHKKPSIIIIRYLHIFFSIIY